MTEGPYEITKQVEARCIVHGRFINKENKYTVKNNNNKSSGKTLSWLVTAVACHHRLTRIFEEVIAGAGEEAIL